MILHTRYTYEMLRQLILAFSGPKNLDHAAAGVMGHFRLQWCNVLFYNQVHTLRLTLFFVFFFLFIFFP